MPFAQNTPRGVRGETELPVPDALVGSGLAGEQHTCALSWGIPSCPYVEVHSAGVWHGMLTQGPGPWFAPRHPFAHSCHSPAWPAATSPGISVPPPQFILSWVWGHIGVQMLKCWGGNCQGRAVQVQGSMSGLSTKGFLLVGFSTTQVGAGAGLQRGTDPSLTACLQPALVAPPAPAPRWLDWAMQGASPLWGGWGCREAQTTPSHPTSRSTVPGEKQASPDTGGCWWCGCSSGSWSMGCCAGTRQCRKGPSPAS